MTFTVEDMPFSQAERAESAALGCLLLGGDMDHAIAVLPDPDHPVGWYRTAHGTVWRAMLRVHGSGRDLDLVSLFDALQSAGTLDEVGGATALSDMQGAAPAAALAEHWCDQVAEWHRRRKLSVGAAALLRAAPDMSVDPTAIVVDLEQIADEHYATDDLTVWHGDQLDRLPDPEWLVDGLIQRGLTVMWGHPSAGKSFVAVDLAVHVALGIPWRQQQVRRGRALHLAGEGQHGLAQRYEAAADELDVPRPDRRGWSIIGEPLDLTSSRDVARLDRIIRIEAVDLLIIDTWARYALVHDENDNAAAGKVVAALDRIRHRHGCDIIVVHHARGDGEKMRGATALLGALDTSVKIEKDEHTNRVVARDRKIKDGPPWRGPLSWEIVGPAGRGRLQIPGGVYGQDAVVVQLLDELRDGQQYLEAAVINGHGPEVAERLRAHRDVTVTSDPSGRPMFVYV